MLLKYVKNTVVAAATVGGAYLIVRAVNKDAADTLVETAKGGLDYVADSISGLFTKTAEAAGEVAEAAGGAVEAAVDAAKDAV